MISIIICSRNKEICQDLYDNIRATIGTDFEIVLIDNSDNCYCMCSAYNEGVRRAKGEYLCFMHEDILFLSKDWGLSAIKELNKDNVGMVGVIGSTYYDRSMSYWCHTPFYVGHNWVNDEHRVFSADSTPVDVVAIDGLWMFTTKQIFDYIRWDDVLFKRFDMYDMDISMQILKSGKKIRVLPGVHIDHKSNGNYSKAFYEACMDFHKKWDHMLPVSSIHPIEYCNEKQSSYSLWKMSQMDIYTKELLEISFVKIALKINKIYHKIKKSIVFLK